MKDNKRIFTQGFIDGLETPKVRTQYYDLRVPGLLLEIMPTGAKFFRFRKRCLANLSVLLLVPTPN